MEFPPNPMIPIRPGGGGVPHWQSLPTVQFVRSPHRIEERSDPTPTRNVNLTDGLDSFVAYQLESGGYENASEVVRDGLRILERAERQHLATIRAAINQAKARATADGVQK